MGKKELSGRDNWQSQSGVKAIQAETNLYDVFDKYFANTEYILHRKPKHLKNIYTNVELPPYVIGQIYNPNISQKKIKWGVSPDFAIENKRTKKILFGEIKRQDGWVEGKSPSAGRGNVHERLCKLFTPGLLNVYREVGGINNPEILPFWVVFEGDITRDPKRNREIAFWFDKYQNNYFMWQPNMTGLDLVNHFENYLKQYLE
ncbi:MAG: MunI family type II restriction endonuclease [Acutalibacteraceae bacterium]